MASYTYGPALPSTGTIDKDSVRIAKGLSGTVDLQTLCTQNINPYEVLLNKPNGSSPYRLLDFRGYRHKCVGCSVNTISVDYNSHSLTYQVYVFPNATVSRSVSVSWVSASIGSNNQLSVSILFNHEFTPRTANILLSAGGVSFSITVFQAAHPD